MNLEEAVAAVRQKQSGSRVYGFGYDEWSQAEHVLRQSGEDELAERAHQEAVRAYHKEEWDADLL